VRCCFVVVVVVVVVDSAESVFDFPDGPDFDDEAERLLVFVLVALRLLVFVQTRLLPVSRRRSDLQSRSVSDFSAVDFSPVFGWQVTLCLSPEVVFLPNFERYWLTPSVELAVLPTSFLIAATLKNRLAAASMKIDWTASRREVESTMIDLKNFRAAVSILIEPPQHYRKVASNLTDLHWQL